MRSKDENKEKLILSKALDMIVEQGLSGLKMSNLAKEVGIAIGTIYIYFKDKEELINALYVFLLNQEASQTLPIVEASLPLQEKLEKICFQYLKHSLAYPANAIFYEQYIRSPYYSNNQNIQALEDALFQPFFQEILQGQQQGLIKSLDIELLINMVCGSLEALAKHFIQHPNTLSEAYWKQLFPVIWDGIKQ